MTLDIAETADNVQGLRNALVDDLVVRKQVQSKQVEAVMRAVPRHVFIPEVSVEKAYVDGVVVTKRNAEQRAISSASAPWIVGLMLDRLDVRPGHRVLEIGAGTGYNAALLAHLVGDTGSVTTVDFDQDTVERARAALAVSGHERVNVVRGDGELGFLADAPYDRIIATVGVADLPRSWWNQLTEGGLLVVPLRIRSSQRVIAFQRKDHCWHSASIDFGGFMDIRGIGAQPLQSIALHTTVTGDGETHDVTLVIDESQSVDDGTLGKALAYPRHEVATGVCLSKVGTAEEETSEWLQLWLTYSMAGYCHIGATDEPSALVDLPYPHHYNPAVFTKDSFAYLALRPVAEQQGIREFVVCAHGPNSTDLAERVAEQVRNWDRNYRNVKPRIEAHYPDSPEQLENRFVVEKNHVRLISHWE